VVTTCSRFLQRLRVSLANWCAQPLPMGGYEVLVVNPSSPDGTREHLAAVAHAHPHLAIREVRVSASLSRTKGAMLNHAMAACQGEYVWLTDADCVFSPTAAVTALDCMRDDTLGFCERRFLAAAPTRALLAGRVDPAAGFGELARAHGPQAPHSETWGYCQILPRAVAKRVRYCERTRHFAHTDVRFAEECRAAGLTPRRIPGLLCLHLDHPFAWYGTKEFL
jgi:glycosyltransferase involved in cell wall biosynthesis